VSSRLSAAIGHGYDVAADVRLKGNLTDRLIDITGVPKSIKCDKGEQITSPTLSRL
jgi:hypothetical protein